ncbi:MAG: hypothetical protein ACRDVE_22045 [Actinocrinis sp.]
MIHLRRSALGVAAAAGIAAVALAAAPASAATTATAHQGTVRALTPAGTVRPDAGWLGTCYGSHGSNWGGGWCDGNGPDWVYQGFVDCTNGGEYYGVVHWAGDRRGSYGYCPSGSSTVNYGVYTWYQ